MLNKFFAILKLTRLTSSIGYLLCFYPACFGTILACTMPVNLNYFLKFLLGSVIVRSAGCIINDIFDRKIDGHVERTKNRPLVTGDVSLNEALVVLVILLMLGLYILISLNKLAIYLGVISLCMIAIYPLVKRYIYLPQLFLGLTFNMGALIAYSSIKNYISMEIIIIYIACAFWTTGYDTIYAFMDINDDKKIGVKSFAILLENKNYKAWLASFYLIFIYLFLTAGLKENKLSNHLVLSGFFIFIALLILLWSVVSLNVDKSSNCLVRFKINNYVGLILSIGLYIMRST